MGHKAQTLQRLRAAGFPVPRFFVIAPYEPLVEAAILSRCARLAHGNADERFAVRSSAQAEDGAAASYAGMFETFLFVAPEDVSDRVRRVRDSRADERVRAYDAARGLGVKHAPSAIVQIMIDADTSGVAFGRDPVDGSDRAVIAATYGLGTAVVGGDCDSDTYRVSASGEIVERSIAHKAVAHRSARTLAGVHGVPVPSGLADAPALCDEEIRTLVQLLRSVEAFLGETQDIEWARCRGKLYVLQARPVTSPPGFIWDNSNIAESYGGLVSPLTFSFARYAYAAAYRDLMHVFGIDRRTIDDHDDALQNMLGLVGGRMYYNLLNWYRLLALVPGFRLNRKFMENMMGVGEPLPQQTLRELARKGKARDLLAVAKMLLALAYRFARLNRDIEEFHRRTAVALAASPPLQLLDPPGLLEEFSRLEAALLTHWEAPLVNDFFAMVFHGLLRALTERWCADAKGSLHNDLLCAAGGMVSTEPARRIAELADLARDDDELIAAIGSGDAEHALGALRKRPRAFDAYVAYLDRFGDRCPNELKLESLTLHNNPIPLLQSVARLAKDGRQGRIATDAARAVRSLAEERVARVLRHRPIRSAVFSFVLHNARARIRNRENLRLERTRVFARVREIVVELGRQLHERGQLANARDVFLVELPELRAAMKTPDHFQGFRDLVVERRALFADYAAQPAPPDRFTAIGPNAPPVAPVQPDAADVSTRTGTGCCPGIVRARVRVVRDVHTPLQSGEILVAERTDPGWIVLFPAAAGILVERGSLLSHAAIVSRELGIPSVVGIAGLMRWLRDGDLVELDGRTGIVRRLDTPVP